jgi:hypothetical protein
MQAGIRILRHRPGPYRSISVYHIDQPSNDFRTLFEVLDADPDRYTLGDPNVFPGAIGRSFYENVLLPNSAHLGWSSYAVVWLSSVPALIPDYFMPVRSTGAVRTQFECQAAQDWKAFLSLRSRELRKGGRLVAVLPALADDGTSGFENLMDEANAVLAEMVVDGAVMAEERARMTLGAYPRRKCKLLAPFEFWPNRPDGVISRARDLLTPLELGPIEAASRPSAKPSAQSESGQPGTDDGAR